MPKRITSKKSSTYACKSGFNRQTQNAVPFWNTWERNLVDIVAYLSKLTSLGTEMHHSFSHKNVHVKQGCHAKIIITHKVYKT